MELGDGGLAALEEFAQIMLLGGLPRSWYGFGVCLPCLVWIGSGLVEVRFDAFEQQGKALERVYQVDIVSTSFFPAFVGFSGECE